MLTEARRPARVSASGELITLGEQDRNARDASLVAEGHRLVRERLATGLLGSVPDPRGDQRRAYRRTRRTRNRLVADRRPLRPLVRLDHSPVVALNRAIAVGELAGPELAMASVDRLEDKLARYHAYHATRADLLRRMGRDQESHAAYDKAIELAGNTAEIAYLTRRRDQLQ